MTEMRRHAWGAQRHGGALALAFVLVAAPAAARPFLVRNLNTEGIGSSFPSRFQTLGDRVLFLADDGRDGRQLWATDGTGHPARLPCAPSCRPIQALIVTGDLAFYWSDDALLRTDGSPEGTVVLATGVRVTYFAPWAFVEELDRWLFAAATRSESGGVARPAPWVTDGSAAGTLRIDVGVPEDEVAGVTPLRPVAGRALFVVDHLARSGLWSSDGTQAGTVRILDTRGISPQTQPLAGGLLIGVVPDGTDFRLAWTDGTAAGTRLLPDFHPDGVTAVFGYLTAGDGETFMVADDGVTGTQLWRTDGTSAGTRRLTFVPGGFFSPTASCYKTAPALDAAGIRVIDGIAYATLPDEVHGCELWSSDGTAAGTKLVGDVCPGACGSFPMPAPQLGSPIHFVAEDLPHGREWWRQGAGAAPSLSVDLCPGSCDGVFFPGHEVVASRLLFGGRAADSGWDVWSYGGTQEPLRLTQVGLPSRPVPLGAVTAGGRLVFGLDDRVHGNEPWVTDGTPGGTSMLANLHTDLDGGSRPEHPVAFEDDLVFFADDDVCGLCPFRTDGTAAGTTPLRDTGDEPSAALNVDESRAVEGGVYFVQDGDLWFTDGGPDSAQRLLEGDSTSGSLLDHGVEVGDRFFLAMGGALRAFDPSHGSVWRSPPSLSVLSGFLAYGLGLLDGRVYFAATSPAGDGLWSSDGSTEGTWLVAPFDADELPREFVTFAGHLVFGAGNGLTGREPWITDGTTPGTRLLSELVSGHSGSEPHGFAAIGDDVLWFVADNEDGEAALFRLESTDETPLEVLDWNGSQPSRPGVVENELFFFVDGSLWWSRGAHETPRRLLPPVEADGRYPVASIRDRIVFVAREPAYDVREIWTSDGSASGTARLAGFRAPPVNPGSTGPVAVGDRAVWTAVDDAGRPELRATDGTVAGTHRVASVPGATGAFTWLTAAGDLVYFAADVPGIGEELWAIRRADLDRSELRLTERFAVEVEWRDFAGRTGVGTPADLRTDDSGLLWFFDEENWEMLVKVIDACGYDGHAWVFAASTTTVEYTLRVIDTWTGETRTYENPLGRIAPPILDTGAFDCAGAASLANASSEATASTPASSQAACPAGTLCLGDGRFRVSASWRTSDRSGTAFPVPGSDDSGLFWFFADQNWEMLVKVLDGCEIDGHKWVFAASTTDVGFDLRVEDTATGQTRVYHNPIGHPADPIVDTASFATCP